MRRRERLTGFFIIFILLIFSAYSNSMNVGGRTGTVNTQTAGVEKSSQAQSSFEERNKNLAKDINDNNLENSAQKKKEEAEVQLDSEVDKADSTAEQSSNTKKLTTASTGKRDNSTGNIKSDLRSPGENNSAFTGQREENNKQDNNQKTAFEKRNETRLIDRVEVHKVRSGETLWDIAHKHGLNIDSLIGANNISNMNSIKPGQEFKILPVKGIIYRVSPGESVGSIARKFDLKTETIMRDNNIQDASGLKIDQKLILRGAKPEFSYQDRLDQKFMYPINTRITSYYGPRWGRIHEGLDFAAPMGSPIRVVSSGRVVYSGWATGYGYVVIVQHQRGLRTLYAHNSKLLVREGESVGKGEVIARSGNTGNSTGPHLHFEVQVNGRPENPLDYINK